MGNRHTGQKADYDKTLPKLIESLCGQTSTNFQWLVIDDGSTDDTDSIVSIQIEYREKKSSI